jgi:preprotein translocase subunit SecG
MDLLHVGLVLIALPKPLVWLLTAIHVFFCCFLILVVLLQRGRAADLGSAFGAGPSQANLAAMSSEDLLTRATKIFAFAFMATSLLLALLAHGRPGDVLDAVPDDETAPAAATAPTTEEPAVPTEEPAVPTEEPAPTTEEPAPTTEEPAVPTEEPAPTTEPAPPEEGAAEPPAAGDSTPPATDGGP